MKGCAICREVHEPRPLSFDGKGVNSCGMYRTRLATFSKDAPAELLGPMFAAAPALLEACQAMLSHARQLLAVYGTTQGSGAPISAGMVEIANQAAAAIALATGQDGDA